MPLDRAHVTVASRVMLPAYTAAYLALGVAFVLQRPSRTSTGAFDLAKQVLPVPLWGAVFLSVGLVMAVTMKLHQRRPMIWALRGGTSLTAFWAVLLLVSVASNPTASYTSVIWVLLGGVAQFASARSLAEGER